MKMMFGIVGVTDLRESHKELFFTWRIFGKRNAIRICKLPWTSREVIWSKVVYEKEM